MLRTYATIVGILASATWWAQTGVGLADDAPPSAIIVTGDTKAGGVETSISVTGAAAAITQVSDGGRRRPAPSGRVSCTWTTEARYLPGLDGYDGGTAGIWYDVRCSDGSAIPIGVFVPVAVAPPAAPTVSAETLAETAANRLQLPSPRVGHSPQGQALVGLATWFWVDPAQGRPLRQRTALGPVWAEVTASLVSTRWDPGDGTGMLGCLGGGQPYDVGRPESQQATACAHTYRRSSADQPQTGPDVNDRFFTVTVTATWQVNWVGSGGTSGVLPPLTRTSSFPLAVAQRQTVVTGGSG